MKPKFITYTGAGGWPLEQERADKVFIKGTQYLCIGGDMGQSSTYLEFEGINGSWNSALFDVDIDTLGLRCPYNMSLSDREWAALPGDQRER